MGLLGFIGLNRVEPLMVCFIFLPSMVDDGFMILWESLGVFGEI